MAKLTQVAGAVTRALRKEIKAESDLRYLAKTAKAYDSDRFDGLDSTAYSRSNHTHTAAGVGAYTKAESDGKYLADHVVASGTPSNITKSGAYRINPGATGFPAGDYSTLLHVKGKSSDTQFQLNASFSTNKLFFRSYNNSSTARDFDEIFHTGFTPTKNHVGLGNVPNYVASSSTTLASDTTFATAHAVKKVNDSVGTKLSKSQADGYYLDKTANAVSSSYMVAHDDRDVKPNTTGVSAGIKGVKAFFVFTAAQAA